MDCKKDKLCQSIPESCLVFEQVFFIRESSSELVSFDTYI